MGYVNNRDRMASGYSVSHHTWNWTETLFFHPSDQYILNGYILLSVEGKSHKEKFDLS
jgi:hypothetical protein